MATRWRYNVYGGTVEPLFAPSGVTPLFLLAPVSPFAIFGCLLLTHFGGF